MKVTLLLSLTGARSEHSPLAVCSVCAARYMAGFGHTCHKRPQGITRVIGAVITGLVAFVLIATLSYLARRAVSRESTDADCDGMESEKRGAMQSLKMVIVAWQIVTQVTRGCVAEIACIPHPRCAERILPLPSVWCHF